jgi:hypothetical protein
MEEQCFSAWNVDCGEDDPITLESLKENKSIIRLKFSGNQRVECYSLEPLLEYIVSQLYDGRQIHKGRNPSVTKINQGKYVITPYRSLIKKNQILDIIRCYEQLPSDMKTWDSLEHMQYVLYERGYQEEYEELKKMGQLHELNVRDLFFDPIAFIKENDSKIKKWFTKKFGEPYDYLALKKMDILPDRIVNIRQFLDNRMDRISEEIYFL